MTYSESAKGIRIDPVEDFEEFARDCPAGPDGLWDAFTVLEWLGY